MARENSFVEADKASAVVAEKAHARGFSLEEAQGHRMMSHYQNDDARALNQLESAEEALAPQADMAQLDRDDEQVRILRYRAVRADHAGKPDAAQTLRQLEAMAGSTRSAAIQSSYHGAAGVC